VYKQNNQRLIVLILLMGVIALTVAAVSTGLLYRAALKIEEQRLRMTAKSQTRLIEAVARFDSQYSQDDHKEGWKAATVSQVADAHSGFMGFGATGDFELGRRNGGNVEFLLQHGAGSGAMLSLSWDDPRVEPMRRALSGQSGFMYGAGLNGETTLTAYEPVAYLDMGFMVWISVWEVRRPYMVAAAISMLLTLVLVITGGILFVRISNPLIRKLERSEAGYRAIVEAAVDGIINIDSRGTINYTNKGVENIFGYEQEEMLGRNVNMLMPEPYHTQHDSYLRNYLGGGTPKVIGIGREVPGKRKDGTIFPLDLSVSQYTVEGMRYFTGLVRDISERKEAERELRESEARFQAIAATTSIAIFISRLEDGQIIYANQGLLKMFSLEESPGNNRLEELFYDRKDEKLVMMMLGRTGMISNTEQRLVRKNGEVFWAIMAGQKIDYQGRPALLAIITDISEQKETEYILEKTGRSLAEAQRIAHVGSFEWDPAGDIIKWSDETYRILGEEPQSFQPTLTDTISRIHPADRDKFQAVIDQVRENGEKPIREVRITRPNGEERTLIIRGEMQSGVRAEGARMLGIVQDITERKKVETLKNEFVSVVSHELRTPLTSIVGSLGLIKGLYKEAMPDEMGSMVNIAHDNSERLVRLINDILDIEKIESGRMEFDLEPLDLSLLLKKALLANQGYAEKYGVKLEVTRDPGEVMVLGDHDKIMQVMANLISNAAKFSPSGDRVEVELEKNGEMARVSVIDHGAGIPPNFQSRVFEKFMQADSTDTRKKGGTGLGLSICKSIVESHQGQIAFETQPGRGTRFFFDLPLHREE